MQTCLVIGALSIPLFPEDEKEKPTMTTGLSRNQMQACNVMGISPHEFIEMNAENLPQMAAEAAKEQQEHQARITEIEKEVAEKMGVPTAELKNRLDYEKLKLTADEIDVCQKLGVLPIDFFYQKLADAGIKTDKTGSSLFKQGERP